MTGDMPFEGIRVSSPVVYADEDLFQLQEAVRSLDPNLDITFEIELRESSGPTLSPLLLTILGAISGSLATAVVETIKSWLRNRRQSNGVEGPITVELLGPDGTVLKNVVLNERPKD